MAAEGGTALADACGVARVSLWPSGGDEQAKPAVVRRAGWKAIRGLVGITQFVEEIFLEL